MIYRYAAVRSDGTVVEGTLDADSEGRAEEILWQSNLTITELKRQRPKLYWDELLPTLFGVKRGDLILFSRQLALFLDAGIGILGALRILYDQVPKASFKRLLRRIETDLQTGSLFSEALARHPSVFPTMYTTLTQAAESTGNLQTSLRQLATYFQRQAETMNKVRGALAYPAFILVMAGFSVFVMMNFALPALTPLITGFKAELPAPTKIMLALANFSGAYGTYVGLGMVAIVAMVVLALRTNSGQYAKDYLLLRTPLVGEVIHKSNLARLARTMAMLVGAGISIIDTMDLAIRTSENLVMRRAMLHMRSEVIAGRPISQAMGASSLFPAMLNQMVRVGEETGTLEANLESAANIYDEDTDRAIARLTGMVEPALMLVVGVVVGFVAVSIVTPIYSVIGQMR